MNPFQALGLNEGPALDLQRPGWEWWIVLYFFLGGVAAGVYFTGALLELFGEPEDVKVARLANYIAFPLVIVCGILLVIDLGRPERFWHMLWYSNEMRPSFKLQSPMSVGAYGLMLFGAFSSLSFVDSLLADGKLRWRWLQSLLDAIFKFLPRRVYIVLGTLSGFFLASYTGVLLATTHLPVWASSPFLGVLFLASAASSGMAALALAIRLRRQASTRESEAKLHRADNFAMLFELLMIGVFILGIGTLAGRYLITPYGLALIVGTVIIGLLLPLVLSYIDVGREELAYHSPSLAVLTPLLVLVGGLILRAAIVIGGQAFLAIP